MNVHQPLPDALLICWYHLFSALHSSAFFIAYDIFYVAYNYISIFKGFERTFKGSERVFKGFEQTFKAFEHKSNINFMELVSYEPRLWQLSGNLSPNMSTVGSGRDNHHMLTKQFKLIGDKSLGNCLIHFPENCRRELCGFLEEFVEIGGVFKS